MTYTVFQLPMHPMKDAECFAYAGKDHDYKNADPINWKDTHIDCLVRNRTTDP